MSERSPKRRAARLLAGVALCCLTSLPGLAEEAKGPNTDPLAKGTPGAVATLALAHELFTLGRAHGDPLTVLAAARLAASVEAERREESGKPLKRSSSGEEGEPASTPAPEPATAAEMFDLALSLAAQDAFLTDVILDARDAGARGRIGGAFSQSASLASGRTDSWEIPFTGGAYAELSVLGGGSSDLDIVVTDENGNVICFEGGGGDSFYCDFVPSWDGFFYVAVENRGGSPAAYELITN